MSAISPDNFLVVVTAYGSDWSYIAAFDKAVSRIANEFDESEAYIRDQLIESAEVYDCGCTKFKIVDEEWSTTLIHITE